MKYTDTPIENLLNKSSMNFHNTTGFSRSDFKKEVTIEIVSSEFGDVSFCTMVEKYNIFFTMLNEEWLQFKRGAFMKSILDQGAQITFLMARGIAEGKTEVSYEINLTFKE